MCVREQESFLFLSPFPTLPFFCARALFFSISLPHFNFPFLHTLAPLLLLSSFIYRFYLFLTSSIIWLCQQVRLSLSRARIILSLLVHPSLSVKSWLPGVRFFESLFHKTYTRTHKRTCTRTLWHREHKTLVCNISKHGWSLSCVGISFRVHPSFIELLVSISELVIYT